MPLFLVRHAHAIPLQDDAKRPLSERGRAQVRALAAFFRHNGVFSPAFVWHSPLLRARETAELLLIGLGSEAALVETPGLLPADDPNEMATRLKALSSAINIALVGHEPQLSALASLLLQGNPDPAVFELKKASVLALERAADPSKKSNPSRWRACWHIRPDLLSARPALAEPDL